ncbi:MAG: 16S rRNA (cytosine(967)-C(5))-methyltransferase RsmB, partial [Clostridia bacterium]|nr:16S rRNA (cytosine(967)-C(5))-methyltransferase RsmB [Clostridia bacterium]
GMKILDACACPGSKSFGMAIDSGDRADIRSLDLHPNKISLIREGALRLGLTSVREGVHDARKAPDGSLKDADIVLCDVPCSGYGVIFKKPEIKYKDPDSCKDLPKVQYEILSASSDCVKPGGELIYSTCTILPEENEGVVRQFLDAHPEFGLEPFRVGSLEAPEGMLTLYPHIHGTDGFFMAKLRRVLS